MNPVYLLRCRLGKVRNMVAKLFSGKGLFNVTVDVCKVVEIDCEVCGTVEETLPSSWFTLFCPGGGIEGNYGTVRNAVDGHIIHLCEIEFYGQELSISE